jgi:hypothetical protein
MFNIHRLLITSIVISIKINEDDYFSNSHYAQVGGIRLEEMNNLEEELITGLNWETWISIEIYENYSRYLNHYQKVCIRK